jgi:hypothetical protein
LAFVDWTASEWSALGSMLLAFGAIVAGGWAIYNYHKVDVTKRQNVLKNYSRNFT